VVPTNHLSKRNKLEDVIFLISLMLLSDKKTCIWKFNTEFEELDTNGKKEGIKRRLVELIKFCAENVDITGKIFPIYR
ncbi:hypothetical protein ACJX0J_036226, partial [Zea mays]